MDSAPNFIKAIFVGTKPAAKDPLNPPILLEKEFRKTHAGDKEELFSESALAGMTFITFNSVALELLFGVYMQMGINKGLQGLGAPPAVAFPAATLLAFFNYIVDSTGTNWVEDAYGVLHRESRNWEDIPHGTKKRIASYLLKAVTVYVFSVWGSADTAAFAQLFGIKNEAVNTFTALWVVGMSITYYACFTWGKQDNMHLFPLMDKMLASNMLSEKDKITLRGFRSKMAKAEVVKSGISQIFMRTLTAELTLLLIAQPIFGKDPANPEDRDDVLNALYATGAITAFTVAFQRTMQPYLKITNPKFAEIFSQQLFQIKIPALSYLMDVLVSSVTTFGWSALMYSIADTAAGVTYPWLPGVVAAATATLTSAQSFMAHNFQTHHETVLDVQESRKKLLDPSKPLSLKQALISKPEDIFNHIILQIKQEGTVDKLASFVNFFARGSRIVGYGGFAVNLCQILHDDYGIHITVSQIQQIAIMLGFGVTVQAADGHTFYFELMGDRDDAAGTWPYYFAKMFIGTARESADRYHWLWRFIAGGALPAIGCAIAGNYIGGLEGGMASQEVGTAVGAAVGFAIGGLGKLAYDGGVFTAKANYDWDPVFDAWLNKNAHEKDAYLQLVLDQLPKTADLLKAEATQLGEQGKAKEAAVLAELYLKTKEIIEFVGKQPEGDKLGYLAAMIEEPSYRKTVVRLRDDMRRNTFVFSARVNRIANAILRDDHATLNAWESALEKAKQKHMLSLLRAIREKGGDADFEKLVKAKSESKDGPKESYYTQSELTQPLEILEQWIIRQKIFKMLVDENLQLWRDTYFNFEPTLQELEQAFFPQGRESRVNENPGIAITEDIMKLLEAFEHSQVAKRVTEMMSLPDEVLKGWLDLDPERKHQDVLVAMREKSKRDAEAAKNAAQSAPALQLRVKEGKDSTQEAKRAVEAQYGLYEPPPRKFLGVFNLSSALPPAAPKAPGVTPVSTKVMTVLRDFGKLPARVADLFKDKDFQHWVATRGKKYSEALQGMNIIASKNQSLRVVDPVVLEGLKQFEIWKDLKNFVSPEPEGNPKPGEPSALDKRRADFKAWLTPKAGESAQQTTFRQQDQQMLSYIFQQMPPKSKQPGAKLDSKFTPDYPKIKEARKSFEEWSKWRETWSKVGKFIDHPLFKVWINERENALWIKDRQYSPLTTMWADLTKKRAGQEPLTKRELEALEDFEKMIAINTVRWEMAIRLLSQTDEVDNWEEGYYPKGDGDIEEGSPADAKRPAKHGLALEAIMRQLPQARDAIEGNQPIAHRLTKKEVAAIEAFQGYVVKKAKDQMVKAAREREDKPLEQPLLGHSEINSDRRVGRDERDEKEVKEEKREVSAVLASPPGGAPKPLSSTLPRMFTSENKSTFWAAQPNPLDRRTSVGSGFDHIDLSESFFSVDITSREASRVGDAPPQQNRSLHFLPKSSKELDLGSESDSSRGSSPPPPLSSSEHLSAAQQARKLVNSASSLVVQIKDASEDSVKDQLRIQVAELLARAESLDSAIVTHRNFDSCREAVGPVRIAGMGAGGGGGS